MPTLESPVATIPTVGRDPKVVSEAMRRVKGRDTSPEVAFRKALWARGLRYRLYDSNLPGKPDIVFHRSRLVVFIDGDFWHGNQWQRRGFTSLDEQFTNVKSKDYWVRKISRNMERDRINTSRLVEGGWSVLRFWESQLAKDFDHCVEKTENAVRGQLLETSLPSLPDRSFAEFFAGIGLMRLALERHGWKAKFANDIDPKKKEMYAANFPDDPPGLYEVENIHYLKGRHIPNVTLATASFPCTDLSLAGPRNGLAGVQSGALFGFLNILKEMESRRPPIVLLENVPGFLTSHRGEDFRCALRQLNSLGYAVDAFMINAIQFVPQSRERLFVVGVRGNDDRPSSGYLNACVESPFRPRKLATLINADTDIQWHIRNLPFPIRSGLSLVDVLEDDTHDSAVWWSKERTEYLLNQMSEKHSRVVAHMKESPDFRYGTVFRRMRRGQSMAELRTDGIAGCLRTPRGGSSRQILLKAGKGKVWARFFTPRECARLQGVPDSYRITVPMNQALFGFGDAVCVPVVEWIAEHYLNLVVTQLFRGRLVTGSLDRRLSEVPSK